jgi:hypothetical protein
LSNEKIPSAWKVFRVFTKIWNSLAVNAAGEAIDPHSATWHLSQIGARPRQAFLRVSPEGLSKDEASHSRHQRCRVVRAGASTNEVFSQAIAFLALRIFSI